MKFEIQMKGTQMYSYVWGNYMFDTMTLQIVGLHKGSNSTSSSEQHTAHSTNIQKNTALV